MKKLIALLLCALLLCGAALAEDLSARTTEELVALIRATQTELAMRNVDPEKVIYQNDELGIIITVEGTSYRNYTFTVKGKIINASEHEVDVDTSKGYVNNWGCMRGVNFLYAAPGRNNTGSADLLYLNDSCEITCFEDLLLAEMSFTIKIDGKVVETYDLVITDFSNTAH